MQTTPQPGEAFNRAHFDQLLDQRLEEETYRRNRTILCVVLIGVIATLLGAWLFMGDPSEHTGNFQQMVQNLENENTLLRSQLVDAQKGSSLRADATNPAVHGSGFVYYAAGRNNLVETLVSASSVRQKIPAANITVVVDGENYRYLTQGTTQGPFDLVLEAPKLKKQPSRGGKYASKVSALLHSPYVKTIFMDGDTFLCQPDSILSLLDLLDHFEVAAAHAPYHNPLHLGTEPEAFTELNTGVFAMRKTNRVVKLLHEWIEYCVDEDFVARSQGKDQPALMNVLYRSQVRPWILTPEYNCRFHTSCADRVNFDEHVQKRYECVVLHNHDLKYMLDELDTSLQLRQKVEEVLSPYPELMAFLHRI